MGKLINRAIHDLKVKFLGLSVEGCLSTMLLSFMVVRKKMFTFEKTHRILKFASCFIIIIIIIYFNLVKLKKLLMET
jgi:ABC-type nickel/cobalt efflux system permease component RcnA